MAVLKVSAEVFACHSAACRPPGSGGSGGSGGGGGQKGYASGGGRGGASGALAGGPPNYKEMAKTVKLHSDGKMSAEGDAGDRHVFDSKAHVYQEGNRLAAKASRNPYEASRLKATKNIQAKLALDSYDRLAAAERRPMKPAGSDDGYDALKDRAVSRRIPGGATRNRTHWNG